MGGDVCAEETVTLFQTFSSFCWLFANEVVRVATVHVTKLDAARRQLEVAVRLYFNEGDPVSRHTLTAAAYTVLRDVNSARSGTAMEVTGNIDSYIKPEFVTQIRRNLIDAQNFFKHADRDPNRVLEFNPRLTEILLLDACLTYKRLAEEAVPEFLLYVGWLMLQEPTWFIFPQEIEALRNQVRSDVHALGRAQFFAEMLPVVSKQGVVAPTR
jgi:hypothetical protein